MPGTLPNKFTRLASQTRKPIPELRPLAKNASLEEVISHIARLERFVALLASAVIADKDVLKNSVHGCQDAINKIIDHLTV